MNKERLAIYPYDIQCTPLLRHQDLFETYKIVQLISPPGLGLEGKDASQEDLGAAIGMSVTGDFERSIESCDTVLFSEAENSVSIEHTFIPKIKLAIEKHKNIILTFKMDDSLAGSLQQLCDEKGVRFERFYGNPETGGHLEMRTLDLFGFEVPVIVVLGDSERTQKFEIQLVLREGLLRMGYKVGQIGTRNYCELIGFHSIPGFMFEPRQEYEKIVLFNHYIKHIERAEKPEVIIIGIPGNAIPITDRIATRYATLAYEIAQAVSPDIAIYSTLYAEWTESYFKEKYTIIEHRLGMQIDLFNLSNTQLDWYAFSSSASLDFIRLSHEFIDRKKENYASLEPRVINVMNANDAREIPELIVNKLSEMPEVDII